MVVGIHFGIFPFGKPLFILCDPLSRQQSRLPMLRPEEANNSFPGPDGRVPSSHPLRKCSL